MRLRFDLRFALLWMALAGGVWAMVMIACTAEPDDSRESGHVTLLPNTLAATVEPLATPRAPTPLEAPDDGVQTVPDSGLSAGTTYLLDAVLNWPEHTVQVEQRVSFRNKTGRALDQIIFTVPVNREPEQFTLERLVVGGRRVREYVLDGVRLMVPLGETLMPGDVLELALDFGLAVPQISHGYRRGHLGYWGYSARQVNLGMWFPLIAAFHPSQGWIAPDVFDVGEQSALPVADFAVSLTIEGASDTMRVAGPGELTRPDEHTWRFDLAGGREITLSVSDAFESMKTATSTGVEVELFYFPDLAATTLDAPRHVLHTTADALALYEDLFGGCPYKRLVVVQGDFPDGMEFSGLVFVSDDWFQVWNGQPDDWLTLITAHEVAHQWWYALVANDQGQFPYLDEALAIYCEILFFERYYPEYTGWWWEFRVAYHEPEGFVDAPVFGFDTPRAYINAVYLRGALMMQALREDLGDEAFFDWLQRYAGQMTGRLAFPPDFWGALTADGYGATASTRREFLRDAEIFASSAELP